MSRGYTDYRSDNPYAQQDSGPGGYGNQSGGYGGNQGGYGRGNQGGYGQQSGYGQQEQSYEMNQVPNKEENLLRDVQEVDATIQELERQHLPDLQRLYADYFQAVDEARASQIQKMIDVRTAEISNINRAMVEKLRRMKGSYGNAAQVNRIDTKMKRVLNEYQSMENNFSKRVREQLGRQYRVVNSDATDEEVDNYLATGESQIFSQAVLRSNRTRQAESALQNVRNRHQEIQRIERTLTELAQLFEQMNQQIVEQDDKVQAIDNYAENVRTDIDQGVQQVEVAKESARAARRKKWWCLLIAIIIILVVAAGIAVGVIVNQRNSNNKRRSLEYMDEYVVSGASSVLRRELPDMRIRRRNFIA